MPKRSFVKLNEEKSKMVKMYLQIRVMRQQVQSANDPKIAAERNLSMFVYGLANVEEKQSYHIVNRLIS